MMCKFVGGSVNRMELEVVDPHMTPFIDLPGSDFYHYYGLGDRKEQERYERRELGNGIFEYHLISDTTPHV